MKKEQYDHVEGCLERSASDTCTKFFGGVLIVITIVFCLFELATAVEYIYVKYQKRHYQYELNLYHSYTNVHSRPDISYSNWVILRKENLLPK